MAAHAVGRRGIEAVAREEPARRIHRDHLSIEEHAHQIGVLRAEFHIVGHHHHGYAARRELFQDRRKFLLEEAVDALRRFIQQQKLRIGQQHLGERRALLFAAGEIIGMAVHQMRDFADLGDFVNPRAFALLHHFGKILAHRFFHEQALRILRQHGEHFVEQLPAFVLLHRLSIDLNFAAVRRADAADRAQKRGFARSVAAQYRKQAAARHIQIHAAQNIRRILFVTIPDFADAEHRIFDIIDRRFLGKGCAAVSVMRGQIISALAHGERAFARFRALHAVENARRRGQRGEHIVFHLAQPPRNRARRIAGDDPPAIHHRHAIGGIKDILQTVFGNDHRRAQFQIDLAHRVQKIGSRDGIQLAGGFIENQYVRMHRHDGSQIQQLFLTAR